jgi:hypothetical protein
MWSDRLCDLVVGVPAYRSRGLGSIPGANGFFWEVVGLERDPLSLVSTIEKLLERKNSGSGLNNENTSVGIRQSLRCGTLYTQKFALTLSINGGRSIGIVRPRD